MEQDLIKLGFSSHEATVYLALIDIGQTGTGELIRRTGLHRNIVYTTLDKLVAKKYVFKVIKDKKAQFQVAEPGRILHEVESHLDLAQRIVPDLINRSKVKQEVIIYQGIEGFRDYSVSSLKRLSDGGTIYVLGAIGNRWYELMDKRFTEYEKIMVKKQVHWKTISYEESTLDQEFKTNHPSLTQIKIIPKSYKTPANVQIWEDTIALQTFTDPISVIEIKNPALAESYLNYFDLLWNLKA